MSHRKIVEIVALVEFQKKHANVAGAAMMIGIRKPFSTFTPKL